MSKGIVLLAHGKKGYGYAAFNLAMSIKHYGCAIPIHLFGEKGTFEGVPLSFFDSITWIEKDFYTHDGKLSIAKSKIEILNNLPFEQNIYLDVDGMALKDLTPFINEVCESDKSYLTDVMGTGQYGNENINYDCWARHEYAWPFFGLEKTETWRTIQSSWAYFKRNPFTQSMYQGLMHYLNKGYDIKELRQNWAKGQLPDELLFSGWCAKMGYDPSFKIQPVFFGNHLNINIQQATQQYYILSMYGNGNRSMNLTKDYWQEYYTRQMYAISVPVNMPYFKAPYIMRDKILNA